MDIPTWLEDRSILQVRHGSNAYGTAIEGSDLDIKNIVIPPAEFVFGCTKTFDEARIETPDTVYYDVRKFCRLAVVGNPNILEMLFVDEEDQLWVSEAGRLLLDSRDVFLSQRLKNSFVGYAMNLVDAVDANGPSTPLQWKGAMHALRLMRMCREVLETGVLVVRRPDAEELIEIRRGEWPWDAVRDTILHEKGKVGEALAITQLPEMVDPGTVDTLCRKVLLSAFALPKNHNLLMEAVDLLEQLLPVATSYATDAENAGWILNIDASIDEPTLHWAEDVDGEEMVCGVPNDPLVGEMTALDEVNPRHRRMCPECEERSKAHQSIEVRMKSVIERAR